MTVSAVPAPLARVELARDARTTLVLPAALGLFGIGLVAVAVLFLGGPAMFGTAALGVLVAGFGAWIALRTRSLRLVVETDYLHLTGIRVDRRYHLAHGDLKRVATAGPTGVRLRTRPSTLGLGMGRTTLGVDEHVEVIRLGATPSVILVPTERGRVAVAPASEAVLVQALMGAARTRAERPALRPAPVVGPMGPPLGPIGAAISPVGTAAASSVIGPVSSASAAVPGTSPLGVPPLRPPVAPAASPAAPPAAVQPRPMTGIERMALEERMATERRTALTGARSEQAAASLASMAAINPRVAAAPASALPVSRPWRASPPPTATTVPVPTPGATIAAVATAATAAGAAAAATRAVPATLTAGTPARRLFKAIPRTIPRALPRRRPARPMAWRISRPTVGAELALLATPLVGAGVVWILATIVSGTGPGTDGLDPIGAALLLCGPIAMLAVWLARSRWPRLAGLSSVAAVISLALVARALIG